MPQRNPASNTIQAIYDELKALAKRIEVLENAAYPTIPVYDWEDQPQDAIEGQIALFINTPPLLT